MSDLRLRDLCEQIVDCKNRTPPEAPPGEEFGFAIGTPNIVNGRILLGDAKPVSKETFGIWTARAVPAEDDIILTREAPVGRVGRIDSEMTVCLGQRTMLLRADSSNCDPRFLHYFLLSPAVQAKLHGLSFGSTVPHLRVDQVKDLSLSNVPGLNVQRVIGSILASLDDKIAVNDRIAATALELAEALYLQASSSHDWSSIELGSAASWYSGGTPKTSEPRFWDGEIPWISALSLKGCWIETSERRLTELGAASGTRLVPAGVVIFVVRGSSLKEEFRVGLTQREVAFGQDCKALVPSSGIDPHILFHGIRSARDQILDLVDETSIGAGRLSTDLITKLAIRVPPEAASDIVEEIRSLDQLSAVRTRETRALLALRDALLPELMAGRLRVKDAEKVVEEAV